MNATIAWGAILLLASLTTVTTSETAAPPVLEVHDEDCRFITVVPHWPFVIIDWDCPPPATSARGL